MVGMSAAQLVDMWAEPMADQKAVEKVSKMAVQMVVMMGPRKAA
jgi:hypothetical protein